MAGEIRFDWDDENLNHLRRHNISREEAEQVVNNGITEYDYQEINYEERFVVVGLTNRGRVLTLVLTDREGLTRPITGWDATAKEAAAYFQNDEV